MWIATRSADALPGISIDAPVRERIASNTSDKVEFSASIVSRFPSHAIIGRRTGSIGGSAGCAGGSIAGVGAGLAGSTAGEALAPDGALFGGSLVGVTCAVPAMLAVRRDPPSAKTIQRPDRRALSPPPCIHRSNPERSTSVTFRPFPHESATKK